MLLEVSAHANYSDPERLSPPYKPLNRGLNAADPDLVHELVQGLQFALFGAVQVRKYDPH